MTERKFKVGDKVISLDEDYEGAGSWPNGVVVSIDPDLVRVDFGNDQSLGHYYHELKLASEWTETPHYTKDADGKDFLQRFFENSTPEEVKGAMVFTIGKYIERLGKKDAPEKELGKVIDYATRYRDFLTK